jgi:O-antigen/teichoic acid export membrane protein
MAISQRQFLMSGGIFIILNFVSNVFELGVNGIMARLPEGEYGIYSALFKIFFILTTPLAALQLVVSKEVSSLSARERFGDAKNFIIISLRYIIIAGFTTTAIGLILSPLIADFLNISSVYPVIYLMLIVGFYSLIPVLYGTIQGLQKFITLGFVTIFWGASRFTLAYLFIIILASGLNGVMAAVVGAAILTVIIAYLPVRSLFNYSENKISSAEMKRAFKFFLPIVISLLLISLFRGIDVVFARRFFSPDDANAYACAAFVGSAFFTLSGIFMVMFPVVSEEKTMMRNPAPFLLRSAAVVGGLSFIGIVIAWLFPDLVMIISTQGKIIPGAEPLIRIIGLAVLPISLVYIISNYFLAQHISGFIPILAGGGILLLSFIFVFHANPLHLLFSVGAANFLTFCGMVVYLLRHNRPITAK